MKTLKTALINIFATLILLSVGALCACNKVSIYNNPNYPYDGVSTVYVPELTISFVKKVYCPDDVIDESKFFTESVFVDDISYLMVIDFSYGAKVDNDGKSILNLTVSNTNAESVGYYVIEAATSDIEESVADDTKALRFGFKIPERHDRDKRQRVVIRLTPKAETEAVFKTELTVTGNATISGKKSVKQDLLSSPYGLKLEAVADGYAVTGLSDKSFEEIVIPETFRGKNVVEIGKEAFKDLKTIKKISVPETINTIGNDAFYGCDGLQYNEYDNAIYLGNDNNPYVGLISAKDKSITSCTINENAKTIYYQAFAGCGKLAGIAIPSGVKSIGDSAFSSNYQVTESFGRGTTMSLKSVTFGEYSQLTIIGKGAFYGCNYLISINIPYGVTRIDEKAFGDCDGLTNVTIPGSVSEIGDSAFISCENMTCITIPDSVTEIGNRAFSDCSRLTSITVDANNKYYESIDGNLYLKNEKTLLQYAIGKTEIGFIIPDGVIVLGYYAFYDCKGLTSVTIPDSVTSIGKYAFKGCSGLTSITIPDSVTSIGDYVFSDCSGLTSVTIPDSVTSIDGYAFRGCSALNSLIIPDSVTSISWGMFLDCGKLKSVTIPDSVTSIGGYAFGECSELTSVNFTGTKKQWEQIDKKTNWNDGVQSACIVHCSDGDVNI